MSVEQLLAGLATRGVELWLDGEQVRYRGPEGAITPEVLAGLRESKAEIAAWLRAEQDKPFPLTSGQRALWFLHQADPTSPAYHIRFTVELAPGADAERIDAAMRKLTERHPMLRVCFRLQNGLPVQLIQREMEWRLRVRELAAGEQPEAEADEPFDLEHGPVCRVTLFQRGDGSQVLQISAHHIAFDYAALEVLITELRAFYEGRGDELPALRGTFRAHAEAEGRRLASEEGERLRRFWRAALAGTLPVLEMPLTRPRPALQTWRGETYHAHLPEELTAQLRELARAEGVTLYSVMLSSWQALLFRHTRQEDLIVGTPVSGRRSAEMEGVVGYFANAIPIRTRFLPQMSFRQLLTQTRQSVLEAMTHGEYPMAAMLEDLRVERDMSRPPLFQTAFVWDQSGSKLVPGYDGDPLYTPQYTSEQRGANYDIALTIYDLSGPLRMAIAYNHDLLDAADVQAIADRFVRLLSALDDVSQLVDEIDLGESSAFRLPAQANAKWPTTATLVSLFRESVARFPDREAVSFGEARLSYRELEERSNHLAARLVDAGVRREELVALWVERDELAPIAILGVLKAGAAYLPLDPMLPAARAAFVVKDAGCARAIVSPGRRESVPEGVQAIELSHDSSLRCADGPVTGVRPEDLAYCIYTSGSTGQPKGVLIEHRQVVRLFVHENPVFDFHENDVWTMFHSFSFDFAVWEMFGALLFGGRVVIVPAATTADARAMLALVRDEQVTILNQTPPAFAPLAEECIRQRPALALRLIILAGQQLDPARLKMFHQEFSGIRLVNMYGITETCVMTTSREIAEADMDSPFSPIGWPLPTTHTYVADPRTLRPVPRGAWGELMVGGAGVARGYWNRPELTRERFLAHPLLLGERVYRSGDRVRELSNGDLIYEGRFDDQVQIRGFRVEMGEIRHVLLKHAAVADAHVAAYGGAGEEKIAAWAVMRDETHDGPELIRELREQMRRELPEYMIPAAIVLVESMPLNSNGKVDVPRLPSPELEATVVSECVAPRDRMEEQIAAIWKEVLDVQRIGVLDSFFDLGGHSLMVMRVIARLRSELDVDFPVQAFFEHPTVASIAEAVQQLRGGEPGEMEKLLEELEGLSEEEAAERLSAISARGGAA